MRETHELSVGDLVLIPARIERIGDGEITFATEEPPEAGDWPGAKPWGVLLVNAGQTRRLDLLTEYRLTQEALKTEAQAA